MKLTYQLLIICFVVLSMYFIKDDLRAIYNESISFLNKDRTENIVVRTISGEISNSLEQASTKFPGALKVTGDIFTSNANTSKTILTKINIINLTNKERIDNGNLTPLKENSKLDFSAEKKLQDMIKNNYFEHVSPNGVGINDLVSDVGYEYIIIGENLALGNFNSDESLIKAWMASPGHRANILNKNYQEIGVAVGKGTFDGKNVWVGVQHFGLPKSACPYVDGVLKGEIEINQIKIRDQEEDLAIRQDRINKGVIYEGKTESEQIVDYNLLVTNYNNFILDLKQKIIEYNTEVKNFNSCLSQNTAY